MNGATYPGVLSVTVAVNIYENLVLSDIHGFDNHSDLWNWSNFLQSWIIGMGIEMNGSSVAYIPCQTSPSDIL